MTGAYEDAPEGAQRRTPQEVQVYLGVLSDYFAGLLKAGRGDSARARSLHLLYFFEYVWSHPQLPLYSYRPSRRPAAFLAMVFDLAGDAAGGYAQRLLVGDDAQIRAEVRRRLRAPWRTLLDELRESGFVCLAAVLDETLRAALRTPRQSDLPTYLARLPLYLTPAQLRRVDLARLIEGLGTAEVFDYLRFSPPQLLHRGDEQHPASGDLRRAIRSSYDGLWAAALGELEPSTVTLLAALPVDVLALLRRAREDDDFAVFYARLTDANAPGRSWRPPPHLVTPEDASDFAFLAARGAHNSFSRRALGLSRLGLSSTFPETVRHLDGWLLQAACCPELHARSPWQERVWRRADDIADTRARFLGGLAQRLARSS